MKISFGNEGEIKEVSSKEKPKEWCVLEESEKEITQRKEKLYQKETWNIRNEERAREMVAIVDNIGRFKAKE